MLGELVRIWFSPQLLALLTVLFVGGCRGSFQVIEDAPLAKKGPAIQGFVIFPVADMSHAAKTIDASVRGSDVAAWFLDRTEAPVIGPLDYTIFKDPDDLRVASVDTNLVASADGQLRDLRGWVAVWVQVTENRATNVRDTIDVRKKGRKNQKVYRIHGVEATIRVEVQLRGAMRGRRLATVVVKDIDDPTKMRLHGDPRPRLTELIHKALRLALVEATARVAPQRLSRIVRRAGSLPSAPALAEFRTAKRPSYREVYAKKGTVDLQTAIVTLWSRLAPTLGIRATFFATKFPGILLTADRPPLRRGDVIRTVNGSKVTDRYQLDRALRGCAGEGCTLGVQRAFRAIEVAVAWQPVARPAPAPE